MSAPAVRSAGERPAGIFFYLVAAAVGLVDQVTKLWVVREWAERGMSRGRDSIDVLGTFLRLTYVHNDGAAFGLSLGNRWSFIAVTVLVAAFILFYYARTERTPLARWALALILGGALGNLADRVRIGEVIDFFHVSVGGFSWPIFNVADIGVSVGVGLLAIHLFRKETPEDVPRGLGETADPHDPAGSRGPA